MTRWGCLLFGLLFAPGCVVVDLGVSNPIPGLSTVAVAPFFNLSTEPSADGYRFAEAYFAELQKVPGFQVLPLGVAEAAIRDHQLDMASSEDAVKLAEILGVDAVVVGAITDYSPYYPPRAGWQVAWYSPHPWGFSPGVPTEPFAREAILRSDSPENCEPNAGWWQRTKHWTKRCFKDFRVKNSTVFRGQSEPVFPPRPEIPNDDPPAHNPDYAPPRPLIVPPEPEFPSPKGDPEALEHPPRDLKPFSTMPAPREPLMAYTRLFDGSNADLTATLRDYVELRDDLRSGGWEAQLYRTEDFIRFTAHRMIVEMLALHGGESRRRAVFIWRREK